VPTRAQSQDINDRSRTAPDYISDLLTPVADIPSRLSLRASVQSSSGNLFLPRPGRPATVRSLSLESPETMAEIERREHRLLKPFLLPLLL